MYGITPLEAPFGAEVRGWEPGRALTDGEADTLRAALREHSFLLFRGHRTPSNEEFARLGACFGELINGGELYGLESNSRDVLRVSNELDDQGYEVGYAGAGYLPWHSDYSFRERAAKETLLEAVSVPENGPRTHWVNTYHAYEALDAELRERIQGLIGRHDPMASARHVPEASRNAASAPHRAPPPGVRTHRPLCVVLRGKHRRHPRRRGERTPPSAPTWPSGAEPQRTPKR
jgi:alpha-ketoglutarate-dependent taurine dioxygenase